MRLVKALDRHRRVTAAPYQKTNVPDSAGLTVAQCEAATWAVTPNGRRYRSAGAINITLALAFGIRLPILLHPLPGIRQLQDRTYDWVATNRG